MGATIRSYCHLMSETYSSKKLVVLGDSRTFRATKLEQCLKAIVEKATSNANERMIEEDPHEGKCKV